MTHSNRSELTQLRVSMDEDTTPMNNDSVQVVLQEESTEPAFNFFEPAIQDVSDEEDHNSDSSQ